MRLRLLAYSGTWQVGNSGSCCWAALALRLGPCGTHPQSLPLVGSDTTTTTTTSTSSCFIFRASASCTPHTVQRGYRGCSSLCTLADVLRVSSAARPAHRPNLEARSVQSCQVTLRTAHLHLAEERLIRKNKSWIHRSDQRSRTEDA